MLEHHDAHLPTKHSPYASYITVGSCSGLLAPMHTIQKSECDRIKASFLCCIFHPISYLRPSILSLPPSRNSDPGSHSRLFSPLSTTVRALSFCREKTSALSCLVGLPRIVPTHAKIGARSGWSSSFFFCKYIHNLTTTVGVELQDQRY